MSHADSRFFFAPANPLPNSLPRPLRRARVTQVRFHYGECRRRNDCGEVSPYDQD